MIVKNSFTSSYKIPVDHILILVFLGTLGTQFEDVWRYGSIVVSLGITKKYILVQPQQIRFHTSITRLIAYIAYSI